MLEREREIFSRGWENISRHRDRGGRGVPRRDAVCTPPPVFRDVHFPGSCRDDRRAAADHPAVKGYYSTIVRWRWLRRRIADSIRIERSWRPRWGGLAVNEVSTVNDIAQMESRNLAGELSANAAKLIGSPLPVPASRSHSTLLPPSTSPCPGVLRLVGPVQRRSVLR